MARSWNSENASSLESDKQGDVEKGPAAVSYVREAGEVQTNLVGPRFIWSKISSWGVETRGLSIQLSQCRLALSVSLRNRACSHSGSYTGELCIHLHILLDNEFLPPVVSALENSPYPCSICTRTKYRIITGMVGTLSFEMSLRDSSLVILFFCLLCSVPPAYL